MDPRKMMRSSDAEVAVIEATDQHKHKSERTLAQKEKQKAYSRKSRLKKKVRDEKRERELEKMRAENEKMRAENEKLKAQQEEDYSKAQHMGNESKKLIRCVQDLEGQKFGSLEKCQDLILSENYDQPVGQGWGYANIAASTVGLSCVTNPDFITLSDSLNDLINGPLQADLADNYDNSQMKDSNQYGIGQPPSQQPPACPSTIGVNSSSCGYTCFGSYNPGNYQNSLMKDPNHHGTGQSPSQHLLVCPPTVGSSSGGYIGFGSYNPGTLRNLGTGSSFGANNVLPVFDAPSNHRQPEREHNLELERPRKLETKYEEIAHLLGVLQAQYKEVGDKISKLAEESKGMNDTEPCLARQIQELDKIVYRHREDNVILKWPFEEMPNKSFDCGSETCHTDLYTDELAKDFIEKLDGKEKSKVDFQDFEGLTDEMEKSGRFNLPPSLIPIDETLRKAHGDITAESQQSTPVIRVSYILFCCVIKEMNELQLEQLKLGKMILWRDAINSGLTIGFRGDFAIEHLKKIAHAFFGSKARNEQELKSMEDRMSKLKAQLFALEKMHNSIAERQSSEMFRKCLSYQEYFQGKPLSAGLFPW